MAFVRNQRASGWYGALSLFSSSTRGRTGAGRHGGRPPDKGRVCLWKGRFGEYRLWPSAECLTYEKTLAELVNIVTVRNRLKWPI